MLTLTAAARARLEEILFQTEAPSNMTIRFVPTDDNRLIVSLDYIQPSDMRFVHGGKTLLVLDSQAARRVKPANGGLASPPRCSPLNLCSVPTP